MAPIDEKALAWSGPACGLWQLCCNANLTYTHIPLAYHGQGKFNRNYLIDKILQILIALQIAIAECLLIRSL